MLRRRGAGSASNSRFYVAAAHLALGSVSVDVNIVISTDLVSRSHTGYRARFAKPHFRSGRRRLYWPGGYMSASLVMGGFGGG